MGIIELLIGLTLLYTALLIVVVFQVLSLSWKLRSSAWYMLATSLAMFGAIRAWNMLKLPAAILKAQERGVMPASLTLENWLNIGMALGALLLMIAAYEKLRRDLKAIGM